MACPTAAEALRLHGNACHACRTLACRNVTVTAAKGPDTLLDLQFVRSAVELCGSCTFIFKGFAVGNERRGPGGAVEFFLGQPGARAVFEDGTRFRPGCTTAAESGAVGELQQMTLVMSCCCLGTCMHACITLAFSNHVCRCWSSCSCWLLLAQHHPWRHQRF